MKREILAFLEKRHSEFEDQYDIRMQALPITLSNLLINLGFQGADIPVGFHDALEELESGGYISDLSYSNGGFGRSIGVDGEVSYSNGAKIILN